MRTPLKPTTKITTGCPILDTFLGGGIPCNSVTEISGESGVGKTQLCLQLCLSAHLPPSLGGLSASSLFLLSDPPFPSRRLQHLCFASDSASDYLFVGPLLSARHLLDQIPSIFHFVRSSMSAPHPVRLVVLDSIAGLFRYDFGGDDLQLRAALFFRIAAELKRLAKEFDLAVVVTNQVVDFFGNDSGGGPELRTSGRRVCVALGVSWASCVNSRLFLSRHDDGTRRLHVVFAPHLPDSSTEFVIRRDGVFGVVS